MSKVKGIAGYEDLSSDFNILNFIIQSAIKGLVNTCFPVTVTKADTDNMKVCVKPLIAQTDGQGKKIDMPEIFEIPYMRYQAGTAAFIIDPQEGDIGFMLCFQQDASSMEKENDKTFLPQTKTAYPLYSGIYFGGFLQKAPETFIKIENEKITITAKEDIELNCKNIQITTGEEVKLQCKAASVKADDKVEVQCTTAEIKADDSITINSPKINLGSNAAKALVNETITDILNAHVHTSAAPGAPTSAPVTPFVSSVYTNTNIKESA